MRRKSCRCSPSPRMTQGELANPSDDQQIRRNGRSSPRLSEQGRDACKSADRPAPTSDLFAVQEVDSLDVRFLRLDPIHWVICGILVIGGVVTVVIVLVRRPGRGAQGPGLRKMCPYCGELIQEQASKCDYCGGLIDKSRRSDK